MYLTSRGAQLVYAVGSRASGNPKVVRLTLASEESECGLRKACGMQASRPACIEHAVCIALQWYLPCLRAKMTSSQQYKRLVTDGQFELQSWSTRTIEKSQRLDFWVGVICEQFLEMSFKNGTQKDFDGVLTSVLCGAISVSRIVSDPAMTVARDARAIARKPRETWYLLCITETPWSVRHHGRYSELRSGDLMLLDSREPYELRYPMAGQARTLELPVDWLKSWVADPTALAGRPLTGDRRWSSVLSNFVDALTPEYVARAPLSDAVLSDQLGGLLTLTSADFEAATRSNRAPSDSLGSAVHRALKEDYHTPGLTAAHVARRLGVSVRTVHRAMGVQNMCFSDALMRERMNVARQMIGDPAYDRLALGEIGRRVGLPDPSHFVRQYRRHFGRTPGAERRER